MPQSHYHTYFLKHSKHIQTPGRLHGLCLCLECLWACLLTSFGTLFKRHLCVNPEYPLDETTEPLLLRPASPPALFCSLSAVITRGREWFLVCCLEGPGWYRVPVFCTAVSPMSRTGPGTQQLSTMCCLWTALLVPGAPVWLSWPPCGIGGLPYFTAEVIGSEKWPSLPQVT